MELGSNFDLDFSEIHYRDDNVISYLNAPSVIYGDSGRSMLRIAETCLKKGKILLPSYICKSVVDCFADSHVIQYYNVTEELQIDDKSLEEKLDESVAAVYIMHYFGKLQNTQILNMVKEKQRQLHFTIIEDTTHSFMSRCATVGDYQICSLRKWFSIPDGGVLYSDKEIPVQGIMLEQNPSSGTVAEAMLLKHLCLHGGIKCNEIYRKRFIDCELKLDLQTNMYQMSELSDALLKCMDVQIISEKRKENWNQIYQSIKLPLITPVYSEKAVDFVPFSFPIRIKNRDKFRLYLMEHRIYCAVHWPMETEEQKQIEVNQRLEKEILSLPIDQRYGKEEMDYLINIVNGYNDGR